MGKKGETYGLRQLQNELHALSSPAQVDVFAGKDLPQTQQSEVLLRDLAWRMREKEALSSPSHTNLANPLVQDCFLIFTPFCSCSCRQCVEWWFCPGLHKFVL